MTEDPRHDWTPLEVEALYALPLTELVFRAQTVHRQHHDPVAVQRCTLLSIKTGGCPEDCGYCPQSAHHDAGVAATPLMVGRRRADRRPARRASRRLALLHGRGLARGQATGAAFDACWRWSAACASSAWRPASRSAC